MCKEDKPSCSDGAYCPTKDDIKNHIYRAKKAFELLKFDQHNLELKLKALKDESPNNSSKYMFRSFKQKAESDEFHATNSILILNRLYSGYTRRSGNRNYYNSMEVKSA